MGANQGYQSRRTCNRHPEETFVTRCSRAHVAVASCASVIGSEEELLLSEGREALQQLNAAA